MPKASPLRLTATEVNILSLLAQEMSEPEIASRLQVNARTVNQHVRRALSRHGIQTRLGLVRAWEAGGHTIIDGRKR